MRLAVAREVDDEDRGFSRQTDVRKHVQHSAMRQIDLARRRFGQRLIHPMEELRRDFIRVARAEKARVGRFAEQVFRQICGGFPRGHGAGGDERFAEIRDPVSRNSRLPHGRSFFGHDTDPFDASTTAQKW